MLGKRNPFLLSPFIIFNNTHSNLSLFFLFSICLYFSWDGKHLFSLFSPFFITIIQSNVEFHDGGIFGDVFCGLDGAVCGFGLNRIQACYLFAGY